MARCRVDLGRRLAGLALGSVALVAVTGCGAGDDDGSAGSAPVSSATTSSAVSSSSSSSPAAVSSVTSSSVTSSSAAPSSAADGTPDAATSAPSVDPGTATPMSEEEIARLEADLDEIDQLLRDMESAFAQD